MQPRAVMVLAVGVARRGERRDARRRGRRVASRIVAEREPGGGEARRGLHHLRQDVGRGGEIAALQIIAAPIW